MQISASWPPIWITLLPFDLFQDITLSMAIKYFSLNNWEMFFNNRVDSSEILVLVQKYSSADNKDIKVEEDS